MKRVFLIPVAVLVLAGVATGAYFWVTAQGTAEEAPPPQQEATPTPTPEPTSTPEFTPTTTPSLLPQPSPQPVPDNWLTYSDAETGVTLRYPPDWVAKKSVLSESSGLSTLAIYKPLPNVGPLEREFTHLPVSASVSLTDCCPPGFLEFYACDRPPEKTAVGGYAADRCVYTKEHPPPDGFNFPHIGATILYTVQSPEGDLYFSVGLFTWDETGTVILKTWDPQAAVEAERIVQSLEIAP